MSEWAAAHAINQPRVTTEQATTEQATTEQATTEQATTEQAARTVVRTRSGVTHYGTPAGRGQVMTTCGTRSRTTVGTTAPAGTAVTCKRCASTH